MKKAIPLSSPPSTARSTGLRHLLAAILALAAYAPVHAEDSATQSTVLPASDWSVVFGAKLWANRWESWAAVDSSTPDPAVSRKEISAARSDTRVSVIPQLSVRYKDYLAALSAMVNTDYTLDQQWRLSSPASRTEVDANLGYYFLPGLAATLGYKQLTQQFGGKSVWSGPTLGVSATAPMSQGLSAYGSLGLGAMKVKLADPDGAGNSQLNADYVVSEAGLAYSVASPASRWWRTIVFTLGYRQQTVTTKGYTLKDTRNPPSTTQTDVRDATQGMTLGMLAVF